MCFFLLLELFKSLIANYTRLLNYIGCEKIFKKNVLIIYKMIVNIMFFQDVFSDTMKTTENTLHFYNNEKNYSFGKAQSQNSSEAA